MPSEISAFERSVVVDANVWISAVLDEDRFHAQSAIWLDRQRRARVGIILPALALAEVGGSIARISNDPNPARAVVAQIQQLRSVRIHSLDHDLGIASTDMAIDLRLRGADAVYVALAARLNIPLVTWDNEVLVRASPRITVRMPA